MKKQFYIGLLASLAAGSPFFAQRAFAEEVNGKRDIVVTATRLPDIADAETSALSVLDSSELERRQTIFVLDAIGTLPGVTVTRNGPFGGQASIRIRGAANEQTLVLIDGISLNDPSSPGGGFNAGNLEAGDIDRIEVLRGPQSTLWGSDAIGGLINIVTKRPGEGFSGRAAAEAGSSGTYRGSGSVDLGGERFDARLGGSLITTDGISRADEADGNTEDDGYRAGSLNGRAGYDITLDLRIEAFGRYLKSKTDIDGFQSVPPFAFGDTAQTTDEEDKSGGVAARYTMFDGRLDNVVTVSRVDIQREDKDAGSPTFNANATRDNLRYQGTFKATDYATLSFGAEREETDIKTESFGFVATEGGSTIDSVFLLAEVKPIDTVTVTGGIRRDDHDKFGEVTTGRLGVNWRPVETLELRASWGQGFKAPTIYQLIGDGSFVAPNPNLKPEEADGWDAAATLWLLDNSLSVELGYFNLDTKNLINFSGLGYDNIAKAKSEGVELTLSYKVNDKVTVSGNYTYTDARNAVTDTRLIRVPENAGFVEVDWRAMGKLALTLTAHYNGEEDDVNFPLNVKNDAWTKVDLAARYAVNDTVEVYGRVENLTDEKYQDTFGYGEPGASVYGGVRVTFE